jgi:predicted nucleic acid-binding protein
VTGERGSPATALDTSVIIAGLLSWHEHHPSASAELSLLLDSEAEVVLPLQALLEAYAVMTRLPPPHRLSPPDAWELLEGTLQERSRVVGLDGEEGWDCLLELNQQMIAGGTSYDGVIMACARKGGAIRILTLNQSHFERLTDGSVEIQVPRVTRGSSAKSE